MRDEAGTLRFHALGPPSGKEVLEVARWTYERLLVVLERHGRSLDGTDETPDTLAAVQPVLASCYAASAADVQLLGAAPGQRTEKLTRPVRAVASPHDALAECGGPARCVDSAFDGTDGYDPSTDAVRAVGAAGECRGADSPFNAIVDMVGNVAEWTGGCDTAGGSAGRCYYRGGSYAAPPWTCLAHPSSTVERDQATPSVGFRCCYDP